MKKSNLVFVLKISVLGVLLYFGYTTDQQVVTDSEQDFVANDTLRNALYPKEAYWINEHTSTKVLTLVKK